MLCAVHIFSQWDADLSFVQIFVVVIIVSSIERERERRGAMIAMRSRTLNFIRRKKRREFNREIGHRTLHGERVVCCLMYDLHLFDGWLVNMKVVFFYLIPLGIVQCTARHRMVALGKRKGVVVVRKRVQHLLQLLVLNIFYSFCCNSILKI